MSLSGVLSGGCLGGPIVVISIHREPRLCHTVDDGSGIGIRRDEAIEVGLSQHQQSAVAQSHYVGLARPASQQGHFAEEFAGPEPHVPHRQPNLDRPRRDKKDGVAAVSGVRKLCQSRNPTGTSDSHAASATLAPIANHFASIRGSAAGRRRGGDCEVIGSVNTAVSISKFESYRSSGLAFTKMPVSLHPNLVLRRRDVP